MPAKSVLAAMAFAIVALVSVATAPAVVPLFGIIGFVLMVFCLYAVTCVLLLKGLK